MSIRKGVPEGHHQNNLPVFVLTSKRPPQRIRRGARLACRAFVQCSASWMTGTAQAVSRPSGRFLAQTSTGM
jgi:hypothetical protein